VADHMQSFSGIYLLPDQRMIGKWTWSLPNMAVDCYCTCKRSEESIDI
jgi:hypothetical protein